MTFPAERSQTETKSRFGHLRISLLIHLVYLIYGMDYGMEHQLIKLLKLTIVAVAKL